MKKNKAYMINELKEKTGYEEAECELINSVLEDHFIIGHNNKEKIKNDFMEKLNISEKEADDLYNTCSEIIVKNVFSRKE